MNKTSGIVLGCLASMVYSASFLGQAAEPAQAAPANAPPNLKFTVGKETTYVTGPLDKYGYPDYAPALNDRLRQGVTPNHNANVLFWKAFGAHPEGATMPPEFFQWLGISAPPRRGEYYVSFYRYLTDQLKVEPKNIGVIFDQWDRVGQRPWTRLQYPHFAAWLHANEKPLAVVAEGTKRPRYYSPLVPGKTAEGSLSLVSALLPGVQKCRDFASSLVMRAMLRLGEGRYDDAWQDLVTCHRLGRHLAHGGTLIEGLVGLAIDNMASEAELVFLGSAPLDAQGVKDCRRDLQQLLPMPTMADKVDLTERFVFLDTLFLLDRRGIETLEGFLLGALPEGADPLPKKLPADINWDPALRSVNRLYDRLAAAMRDKDRVQREKQLIQIGKELKDLKVRLSKSGALTKALVGKESNPETRGQAVADLLISMLLPGVPKVQNAADHIEQRQRNLHIAFALAHYQRDHDSYPQKLDALAPKYLSEIPTDLFTGKPLRYLPSENGYLLYSFGVNGRDDGGRSYDDNPPGDDLRVRMPLP